MEERISRDSIFVYESNDENKKTFEIEKDDSFSLLKL